MMIDQTFTFRRIYSLIASHLSFDVQYEWSKWKRYSFTASMFRFHILAPNSCQFRLVA